MSGRLTMHCRTFCVSALLAFLPAGAFAADEDGASGGLPQLDATTYPSQILWLLISFGLLYFVCARVFLPRIGGIIEERRNRIADDYDQAADFRRQAEEAESTYKQMLADAKARAASIAADERASVEADIAEQQAETDRLIEADIAAADQRIAETAAQAAAGVREAARDTTKAMVAALIDETPSDDKVDAALSNLGA